jgi:hypothetical protein
LLSASGECGYDANVAAAHCVGDREKAILRRGTNAHVSWLSAIGRYLMHGMAEYFLDFIGRDSVNGDVVLIGLIPLEAEFSPHVVYTL